MYRRQPRPFISQDEFILNEIMRSKKEREQPIQEVNNFLPNEPVHHHQYAHPIQHTDTLPTPPIRQVNQKKVNRSADVVKDKQVRNFQDKPKENIQKHHTQLKEPVNETPVFNFFSDTSEKLVEEPVFNFLSEPDVPVEVLSENHRSNIAASKNLKAFLAPASSENSVWQPVVSVTASNNLKSLLFAKPETVLVTQPTEKPLNTASVASLKSLLLKSGTQTTTTPSKISYASVTKNDVSATPVVEKSPVQKKGLAQALMKPVKTAPAPTPAPKVNPSASVKLSTKRPPSVPRNASTGPGIEKFASSKMLSSPDPLNLPLPDFEESFFS